MMQLSSQEKLTFGTLAVIFCSSVISLGVPSGACALPSTKLNPTFSNSSLLRANTQEPIAQVPPMPETQMAPIASVALPSGLVSIKLQNITNTQVNYQVLGQTQTRALMGKQETVLQNLPTPITITLVRPDGGFVRILPVENNQPGTLTLALKEANGLEDSQPSLRVQADGRVFAY